MRNIYTERLSVQLILHMPDLMDLAYVFQGMGKHGWHLVEAEVAYCKAPSLSCVNAQRVFTHGIRYKLEHAWHAIQCTSINSTTRPRIKKNVWLTKKRMKHQKRYVQRPKFGKELCVWELKAVRIRIRCVQTHVCSTGETSVIQHILNCIPRSGVVYSGLMITKVSIKWWVPLQMSNDYI